MRCLGQPESCSKSGPGTFLQHNSCPLWNNCSWVSHYCPQIQYFKTYVYLMAWQHCFEVVEAIVEAIKVFVGFGVIVFSSISTSLFFLFRLVFFVAFFSVRMGAQLHRAARSGAVELTRASDLCLDFSTSAPDFPASAQTFLKPAPIFAPIREVCPDEIASRPATFCRLAYKVVCRVLFGSHQWTMSLSWRCAGALGRLLPALRPSPAAQLRCSSASTTGSGSDSGLYEPEGIKEPWIPEYQPRSDEHMETKRSR